MGNGEEGQDEKDDGWKESRHESRNKCLSQGFIIFFIFFILIFIYLFYFDSLGLIFALNVYSVPWSYRLQVFLTVAKVLGLILIILMGFVRLAQGKNRLSLE